MRQIIDERDTAKSWYFAIAEFSNCLIIRSPSLLFHEYLREAFIFTQERLQKGEKRGLISFTHEQKIIWSQTQFNDVAHDQIIFCWQLFAGQVMGYWQMKRKKNLHRMIVQCHLISFNNYNSSYFKQKGKYRYFNHSPSGDSMSRVFLTLISPITKLRYGWCVNFEWLNKAIIQSGWGEGYQLFLAAHWYFRLILRAKVKCIAAVSFVKNFVKFFPVALFQTNTRDIYKAVESAGTVSANREQGFQSLIPWIFLFWSISIFFKKIAFS